jgi:hypothetical protein
MADEARLNELLDLVEQARSEGDKATEAKAIAAYRNETAPPAPPQEFAGAGGYNPVMSRLGGGALKVGESLGMTPENVSNPIRNALAPAEVAGQAVTGGAGMIGSGYAGIGQGVWNTLFPDKAGPQAGDRVRQVQETTTYQPRTGAGQGMAAVVNKPAEVYAAGTNYLGEKTTDITGRPAAGAFVKTLGDVAPALLGRGSLPKSRPRGEYVSRDGVPTTEQLGKAATDAYKRADDAGIAVSAESFEGMKAKLSDVLSKEGIDADLHPNATAALKRVTAESGPVTLQKLETLRRIALDAEDTLVKADAKKAGDIVDTIDEYVDSLSDAELTSGKVKDAAALKEARALYTRKRKAEDIERLIRRAEYSPSGFENGLRIEFRALAKNDRRFNRFTAEEKAAIDKVAKGGAVENTLRLIGKAAPTGIVSGGLSSGAGFAFGGPVGAVALPAVGIAGRMGAKALTSRNARAASEVMRRGPSQPTSGLLATDNPKPLVAGPRGLLAGEAPPAAATTRTAEQIQGEIRALTARAQFELAKESAGSPKVQAFASELARLQNELAATQASQ